MKQLSKTLVGVAAALGLASCMATGTHSGSDGEGGIHERRACSWRWRDDRLGGGRQRRPAWRRGHHRDRGQYWDRRECRERRRRRTRGDGGGERGISGRNRRPWQRWSTCHRWQFEKGPADRAWAARRETFPLA